MRERGLATFAGLVAAVLITRSWWEPSAPHAVLVKVDGDVPVPAWFALPEDARLSDALARAGIDAPITAELPLSEGDQIRVRDGRVVVRRGDRPAITGAGDDPRTGRRRPRPFVTSVAAR